MGERPKNPGVDAGKGLGVWRDSLRARGMSVAARYLETRIGGTKLELLDRIEEAGLPVEPYVQPKVDEFIESPEHFFRQLPEFQTYFALFEPGVERAVGVNREQVVDYVKRIYVENSAKYPDFYLAGHDFVFSGAIAVDEIGRVTANFVLGQYNELSSGHRTSDLTIVMAPLSPPAYQFSGVMGGSSDWRDDQLPYLSESGSEITRPEMADIATKLIYSLPRDGSTLCEGWYEIKVLQHADNNGKIAMHPYFIKAIY